MSVAAPPVAWLSFVDLSVMVFLASTALSLLLSSKLSSLKGSQHQWELVSLTLSFLDFCLFSALIRPGLSLHDDVLFSFSLFLILDRCRLTCSSSTSF